MKELLQQQRRPPLMWQAFGRSLWWRHFCNNAATLFYASEAPAGAAAVTASSPVLRAAATAGPAGPAAEGAAAGAVTPTEGAAETSRTSSSSSSNGDAGGEPEQQTKEENRGREKGRGTAVVGCDDGLPPHSWILDHLYPENKSFHVLQRQQQQQECEQAEELETQEGGQAVEREEVAAAENRNSCRGVAVFDLDGTIITTKSGKRFPVDSDDWRLLYTPETQRKLKELVDLGYHLVILSNQLGVEKGHTTLLTLTQKCESLQQSLGLPMTICFAVADDLLRKPRPAAAAFIFDCLLPYLHRCCCCTPPRACCCHSSPPSNPRTWQQHGEQQLQQHFVAPLQRPLPLPAAALPAMFYVGDAAGRRGTAAAAAKSGSCSTGEGARHGSRGRVGDKGQRGRAAVKDHGDADVKFALNIGMPFFTPEQFFLGIEGEVPPLLRLPIAPHVALPAAGSGASVASAGAGAPQPSATTSVGSTAASPGHQASACKEDAGDRIKRELVGPEGLSADCRTSFTSSSSTGATGEKKFVNPQEMSFPEEAGVLRRNSEASTECSTCVRPSYLPSNVGTGTAFNPRDLLPVTVDKDLLAARKTVLLQKLRGTKTTTTSLSAESHGNRLQVAPVTGTDVSPKKKHPRLFPTDDTAVPRQDAANSAPNAPSSAAADNASLASAGEWHSSRPADNGPHTSSEKEGLPDNAGPAEEQEMVLLVGAPGSGKSTLACTVFKDYVSICQDELRVQQKCTRACEAALRAGRSVIIDMQNTRRHTRSIYIALAKQVGLKKIRCVVLMWPKDFCKHTIVYRSLVAQYRAYRSQLQLKRREAEASNGERGSHHGARNSKRTLIKTEGSNGQNYVASNVGDVRFRLERVPSLVVDSFYKHLEQPSPKEEGLTDTVVLEDLHEFFVPAQFANEEEQQLFFSFLL